jgi:hypothetical protein
LDTAGDVVGVVDTVLFAFNIDPMSPTIMSPSASTYCSKSIFGKNGQEIRRHSGFSIDAKEDYLAKTKSLIEELVGKK